MTKVVVTGAASALGRRVIDLLVGDPQVHHVVALDRRRIDVASPVVDPREVDLRTSDLDEPFAGADVVLHLASAGGPAVGSQELPEGAEVAMAVRVLAAAASASVPTLVLLSSATVYGAWPNNPVPLTEEAPLRPHPELRFAVEKAEIERLAAQWRDDRNTEGSASTVALLRPAPTVSEGGDGWVAQAVDTVAGFPTGAGDPPTQYLHLDDLASAVDRARRDRLDGPRNVAPDGWLDPADRRALAPTPRIRVPERVAVKVASLRWRLGLAPTPPGVLPYARYPWVVANDRLRASGWQPTHSNEEAFVVAHEGGPFTSMSPRRRQELALGVAAATALGLVGGVVTIIRRRSRRRPGHPTR